MHLKRGVTLGLVLLALIHTSLATAAGGVRPTRWTDANMADLAADLVALWRAESRLRTLASNAREVAQIERQRQLLGMSEDGDAGQLYEALTRWWKDNVLGPAFRIANNPAAPCKVAQLVLSKLLEAERQSQLLGLDNHADVDPTNPQSLFSKALVAVKRRCLEQAFDACMESGNGQHLAVMLGAAVRQFQVLGVEDGEFEAQAVYLFRRCTVYQLRYHSQTRVEAKTFAFGTAQDGSVILLSDVDPGSGLAGLAQPHKWQGPRREDPNDVLQSTTECLSKARRSSLECGAPQPTYSARATISAGNLAMKRFYDDIEITPEPRITSTRKSDGNDGLTLTFEPPMVVTLGTMRSAEMTLPIPLPVSKTNLLTAHGRSQEKDIELSAWTRVGNDVLFERTISGQQTEKKIVYSDTTKFELVHRPDLFPPEQIIAKWELNAQPVPEAPNRKPAQPGKESE